MDDIDGAIEQMNTLLTANTKYINVLGARAMVLGEFLDVTLPHLTMPQRTAIAASFRCGIENAMALMDDVPLPASYHTMLLELTNEILSTLLRQPLRNRLD